MKRAKYSVEKMCKLLAVSRSAYYEWLNKKSSQKQRENIEAKVVSIFEQSKSTYGSPRICKELLDEGISVSKSTVARIMKSLGIVARPRRKFVHTTDTKHNYKVFENILNRSFSSKQVNKKWVSYITYIRTKQGWAYLTVILDLADRMVVAWTLSEDLSARNTTTACLKVALQRRNPKSELLFHSDRGVQYCCTEFRKILSSRKYIHQSMSRKGNCWDNAPAESFFKTLKVEWTNKYVYENIEQAQKSIFDYIERWYNTKRKHSTIGFMSPLQKHYFLTETAA